MENLIALSPIFIMVFLVAVFIIIIFLIIKRINNSKNTSETERRIKELEDENKRLKNSNNN